MLNSFLFRKCLAALSGLTILLPAASAMPKSKDIEQSRAAYVSRVQGSPTATPTSTLGSLWTSGGALEGMSSDYKARQVGDTLTIHVVQQTTAQSAGDLSAQRAFQTSSAITTLPGRIKTGGINPLLGANSATQTKGQGSASNTSKLLTSITAQVIAVLPNGNLVVEADRELFMNNQRESMFIRGVLRPGDIDSFNTVPSTALANLEIELKGKGAVSDATKRPNLLTRTVLWFLGF